MKKIIIPIILLISINSFSQTTKLDANRQSLIDAEWAFINMAKNVNTVDAFKANFSSETVVFQGGQFLNAQKAYEPLKPNNSWMKWEPIYTDMAASGDFGYNTGPWEFRVNKTDEKPVAYGHFISVWKKQQDGSWKLAIDIGIDHPQPTEKPALATSSIKTKRKKGSVDEFKSQFAELEKNFIQASSQNLEKAYNDYLSKEARVYRVGYTPFTTLESAKEAIKNNIATNYIFVNGDIANSGDFGFAYGTADVTTKDGSTKKAGYIRIWKLENGKNWKIILDGISYR